MKKLPKELPEGEVLKVTPGKEMLSKLYLSIVVGPLCVLFICGALSIKVFPGFPPLSFIIFWFIILIFVVRDIVIECIALGRTFTFCQKGIYVEFLRYVRFYAWVELKTKRLFDRRNSYGYGTKEYRFGAEFSRSEKKRPQWIMPAEYSVFFHPFAYIFVTFDPHKEVKYPVPYHVDESTFRRLMTEWNVFDEDTRPN